MIKVDLKLEPITLISSFILGFYILLSLLALSYYYNYGLKKSRQEEIVKDNEIERFIQQEKLVLNPEDFESLYCRVPSDLTEIRVAIDDPDYDISLAETGKADSTAFEVKDGRYYISNGAAAALRYQKRNRQLLNKNYFIITSTILTITVLLFQR